MFLTNTPLFTLLVFILGWTVSLRFAVLWMMPVKNTQKITRSSCISSLIWNQLYGPIEILLNYDCVILHMMSFQQMAALICLLQTITQSWLIIGIGSFPLWLLMSLNWQWQMIPVAQTTALFVRLEQRGGDAASLIIFMSRTL